MKILNLYKYILLVICGLQSVTLAAQGLDDDRAINNVLTMRVKMLDEFFQRFNGKYTVHAFQQENLAYIIHSGFISGYQNRYGDNLKPPTNVYHRMTA